MRGTVKPMLYAGGSFVLMPGYEPRAYLEALAKYKCTYSRGVAAVFTMFLQHRDPLEKLDLSQPEELHHRLRGGDARADGRGRARDPRHPGRRELRAHRRRQPVPRAPRRPARAARLAGRAGARYQVRLVGADGKDRDDEGELWISSPYNCLGYHKRPTSRATS